MLRAWSAFTAMILAGAVADSAWAGKCFSDPAHATELAGARAAVDAGCDCFGAGTDLEYRSCAFAIIDARVDAALLQKECRRTARKIVKTSSCGHGSPDPRGPLIPCLQRKASGKVSCRVRPGLCQDQGTIEYESCPAHTHCVNAADTNGDLQISGPSDSGSCVAPPPTFVDNGDGTISDARTRLMWEKLSDDGSDHDFGRHSSWEIAITSRIEDINSGGGFAGYTDWRVPSVYELMTLLRPSTAPDPAVSSEFDTGCVPGCSVLTCSCTNDSSYWTSDRFGDRAWTVDFDDGSTSEGPRAFLSGLDVQWLLRAVRTIP
jgi:hypothetical protein